METQCVFVWVFHFDVAAGTMDFHKAHPFQGRKNLAAS
jgi:hypothetical protein